MKSVCSEFLHWIISSFSVCWNFCWTFFNKRLFVFVTETLSGWQTNKHTNIRSDGSLKCQEEDVMNCLWWFLQWPLEGDKGTKHWTNSETCNQQRPYRVTWQHDKLWPVKHVDQDVLILFTRPHWCQQTLCLLHHKTCWKHFNAKALGWLLLWKNHRKS